MFGKNILKAVCLGILVGSLFCFFTKTVTSQTHYYFNYSSDFFSLRLNNGTYFGNEDYNFLIEINLYQINNIENITFKLELIHRTTRETDYQIEKSFFYEFLDHSIYKNETKIGMIPLFIKDNVPDNQEVIIAEFGNFSLFGLHKNTNKNLLISGKSYPQHSVLTNEQNYTIYYYSDYENLLLYWQIGCKYDITLDFLFDIGKFSGHVKLESTNLSLRTSGNYWLDNPFPLIYAISSISAFILVFIFIRRKLKLNDVKTTK